VTGGHLPATLLAFSLAAVFALNGEIVLGRRSLGIEQWTIAFIVGLSFWSALLFPLSLAMGNLAVDGTFVMTLAAAAAWLLWGRPSRAGTGSGCVRFHVKEWVGAILRRPAMLAAIALTAGAAAVFAILNWRIALGWDGFEIWATRAQMLFYEGRLTHGPPPETGFIGRCLRYPPMIPLFEVLIADLLGRFDFELVKPVFLVFYVCLVTSTFGLVRRLTDRTSAAFATAIIVWLPGIATQWNLGGYCDLPMAAVLAAAAGECVDALTQKIGFRSAAVWLLGSLLMVKSEGAIYAAIGAGVFLWLQRRRLRERRRRLELTGAMLPLAAMAVSRIGYLWWIHVPDPEFLPVGLLPAREMSARFTQVLGAVAPWLVRIGLWGFLWPAFAISAVWLFRSGSPAERAVALWAGFALGADTLVFVDSNWSSIRLHVDSAYPRLLEHIAPLAVATIAAAYARLRGSEVR
jgi:hypothetical protein